MSMQQALTSLDVSRITVPFADTPEAGKHCVFDQNLSGDPLRVENDTFERGILLWPTFDDVVPTEVTFAIGDLGYRYFAARVGIDATQGDIGTCVFIVLCDGREVYRTRVLSGGGEPPVLIRVPVEGVQSLTLRTTNGGDANNEDWGVWGEPTLYIDEADLPAEPAITPIYPLIVCPESMYTRTYALSSGETDLTVAVVDNRTLAITDLHHSTSSCSWCFAPTQLPFLDEVEIDGAHHAVGWHFVSDKDVRKEDERTVTLTFLSEEPALTLHSVWWHGKNGAIKHHIDLENRTGKTVTVPVQPTLWMSLSAGYTDRLRVRTIHKGGSTPDREGIYYTELAPGAREVVTDCKIPIAFLTRGDGEGMYVAHAFGTGRLILDGTDGGASVYVGLRPDFRTDVPAGRTFIYPTAWMGTYRGDEDDAANSLARWLYRYNTPAVIREPGWPQVIFNVWSSVGAWAPAAENYPRTVAEAKAAGIDRIVSDYGWWPKLGCWDGDPVRWPEGVAPAGRAVTEAGLDYVLYVLFHTTDSEAPDALSPVGPNGHPEWLVKNGGSYDYADLGDEDCLDYLKHQMLRKLTEYSAVGYRSDFSPVQRVSVQKNRHRYGVDTEYWCYHGFYELLDYLSENIDRFTYENCCGGGYYKDFETMSRTANIFATDTYRPVHARQSFYDTSLVYPAAQIAPQVAFFDANPAIWDSMEKRKGMTYGYIYRSVMQGVMYVNMDFPIWELEPAERAFFDRQVRIYKAWLRPLVAHASVYHILPRPDGIHWDGTEYYDADTGRGAVYVFRPTSPESRQRIRLKGLELDADYLIRSEDRGTVQTVSGRVLMEEGLDVTLDRLYDSDILYIQRADIPIDAGNAAWESNTVG